MRITGGAARGRALRAPRGSKVRPTADKVRAAIFNILASRGSIAGGCWLDLFAGTGALGLEALSRGATRVTFIDDSRESCRVVRENLERSGFADQAEVHKLPLPGGLRRFGLRNERFDGAFVDPPYRRGLSQRTLQALAESALLMPGAWVVVEHAADEALADRYGALRLDNSRHYGSTGVSLYAMEDK
jgi:16S rRNA (guanine(966)-N(2))-methyltransferase RsmD